MSCLLFLVAPKVDFKQKATTVLLEKCCELEAILGGIPMPNVKWYKDDNLVEESENIKIETVDNISKLILMNAQFETSGTFKCVAENVVGKAEGKCTVTVHGNKESISFHMWNISFIWIKSHLPNLITGYIFEDIRISPYSISY